VEVMASIKEGVFHLKYILTTYLPLITCALLHMLIVLNFIPYGLPRELPFSAIYMGQRGNALISFREFYFSKLSELQFIYFCLIL
jgi:hypothetical protein